MRVPQYFHYFLLIVSRCPTQGSHSEAQVCAALLLWGYPGKRQSSECCFVWKDKASLLSFKSLHVILASGEQLWCLRACGGEGSLRLQNQESVGITNLIYGCVKQIRAAMLSRVVYLNVLPYAVILGFLKSF